MCSYYHHIKFDVAGVVLFKFRTQGTEFPLFPPPFSPGSFSVKDMYALSGGRARSCTSLEMYYMCLTKVICKQKRNPIENMLLCHGTTPCFCVPRACLITFKEHFQTAFWEACQHFFFPQEIFKTIWFCHLYFCDLSIE